MAGQSVTFDFLSHGASQLAGDFRKTGDSAVLAAKGARLLSDALEKQRKASDVSAGATLALAKADKILADAEHVLADGALEAEFALKKQGDAAKKAGEQSSGAAGGMSSLAGGGGIPGGGMGAAIAAAAVLSPVLVTVGFGLAGLGAAAYGIVKPIENAAQKTGGLQANLHLLNAEQRTVATGILGLGAEFHKFEAALQPTVLKDFNAGLRLAGGLMHDIEPVAKATGSALGTVIGQIDAEFRSNNWQNFFQFMGRTAGPDIKLLGNAFVTLTSDLPPLLEALQPVATAILQVVNYTGQAIRLSELASSNFRDLGKASQQSGGGFNAFTTGLKAAIPGLQAADNFGKELGQGLDILYGNTGPAAKGIADTGAKAAASAIKIGSMRDAVLGLQSAESKSLDTQLAYGNALVTQKNDAVALSKALQASGGKVGFQTAAQRASFAAAQTYIGDLETTAKTAWASGKGINGQISALQAGLPALQKAAGSNKVLWGEIKTLKEWLDKLRAEKNIREAIIVTGSGTWRVPTPKNQSLPGGFPGGSGAAAGRLVTGGIPGRDSVPIMAMPGEAIVPRHLTAALAPFLSANRVPGFAAGGIVPSFGGAVKGLQPWASHDLAAANRIVLASLGNSIAQALTAAVSAWGAAGPGGGAPSANAALARRMFPAENFAAWNYVAMRESGWSQFAQNPSSGAYGIAQALPFTKMPRAAWPASAGGSSNPAAQISWMEGYMRSRYGGAAGAAAHERAFNWYDTGGWLMPGLTLAVNKTGHPEQVIPHGRSGGTTKVELVVRTGHGATDLDRAIVGIIQNYVIAYHGGDAQQALGSGY